MTRTIALAVTAALTLAACGTDTSAPANKPDDITVEHVNVDGRDVPCIIWSSGSSSTGFAMSCDWGRA